MFKSHDVFVLNLLKVCNVYKAIKKLCYVTITEYNELLTFTIFITVSRKRVFKFNLFCNFTSRLSYI